MSIHNDHASSEHDLRLLMTMPSLRPTSAVHPNNHGNQMWRQRPRSTPLSASHRVMTSLPSKNASRPKTAAVVLDRSECDRVRQLEHVPTRRHNFESHLPMKRTKQPTWQKNMEDPLVSFQIGQGYIMSRSRSRSQVTITDELFEPPIQEPFRKELLSNPERDELVVQLQQQISDLILFLEEERFTHKQTKLKAEDLLRDRISQMNAQFQEKTREIVADHNEALMKQKQAIEAEHKEVQDTLENQISRMAKNIELLQSSFESYKSTVHSEVNEKLSSREEEQRLKFEEEKQQALHEFKTRFIQERNQERANMVKEHQKAIEVLRKENKKEMDSLLRRFSSAAADVEQLKEVTEELEKAKSELDALKESYSTACQQLTNAANQLSDARLRILDFEKRFDDKVSIVEDRYKHKLQELMTQNAQIRHLFVQKCGELFEEQANSEFQAAQRVKSAKVTMGILVKSKQPTNSSNMLNEAEHAVEDSQSPPYSSCDTRNGTSLVQVTDESSWESQSNSGS